jgi:hypothetical protein
VSGNKDDRLPLRWGVILMAAITAAVGVGYLSGPLAGWTVGMAMTALLSNILASK